mmetsp:Transcript_100970/g.308766  ORF Transcript_100970/g.308766 Transcript_100970/m.308766 type:complete len:250 (-) Transcript_100970:173-922(-)
MHPSISGLLVTWAYLAQITLPVWVTRPSSDTLTSMIVPFVMTPNEVYKADCGFFFTLTMSKQKVILSSGCVTCAFFCRNAAGLMYRSYFGGFRVKLSPTNEILLTMRFHAFFLRLPVRKILNISSSVMALTFGIGTCHFPAFSLRFCLIILDRTFVRRTCSRSNRYAGTAPGLASSASLVLASFSWCALIVFFIVAFSVYRFLENNLALMPRNFRAVFAILCGSRAFFFRNRSSWSKRLPYRRTDSSMY